MRATIYDRPTAFTISTGVYCTVSPAASQKLRKIQGWKFALSLFALSLKIARIEEWLWAICSLIWATASESLLLLFTKQRLRANRSPCSVKRATWVIRSWFERITLKNKRFAQKIHIFCMLLKVFHCFSPFLRANHSHRSLLSNRIDSLSFLFTKERLWAICSRPSWQKSDRSTLLFFTRESLFRSQKTSD